MSRYLAGGGKKTWLSAAKALDIPATSLKVIMSYEWPSDVEVAGVEKDEDERIAQVITLLRAGPKTREELADALDCGPSTVDLIVAAIERKPLYDIEHREKRIILPVSPPSSWKARVDYIFPEGQEIQLGHTSDLHFGSTHHQRTALNHYVEQVYSLGCRRIVASGDITAGQGVYRGQELELYAVGADEQCFDVIQNLPRKPGLNWYLQGGNHDASHYKRGGMNVVKQICSQREDCTYVGFTKSDIPLVKGQYIRLWHPRGGSTYARCISEHTQILTRRGWIGYKTISMSDEVATLNPKTGQLEYQQPTEMFIRHHTGKMVHVESRTVDLLVTPDHDLWVRPYENRWGDHSWRKKQAKDILGCHKQQWQMRMDAEWEGEERDTFQVPFREYPGARNLGNMPMDSFLRFLGWYISEGHLIEPDNKPKAVAVTNTDLGHIKEIHECMMAIGLNARVLVDERPDYRDVYRVRGYSANLARWLKKHAGNKSAVKRVPRFVMDLSKRQIGIFLDALFAGDGTKHPAREWYQYNSVSEQLKSDVQELMLKVGYAATIHKGHSVGVLEQTTPTVNNGDNGPQLVDYDGIVWCVKVPNGLIYARRNGKPVWTGNSYRGQKGAEVAAYDWLRDAVSEEEISSIVIFQWGHIHYRDLFWYGPMMVINPGCFENETIYTAEKALAPEISGAMSTFTLSPHGWCSQVDIRFFSYRPLENDYESVRRTNLISNEKIEPLFELIEND